MEKALHTVNSEKGNTGRITALVFFIVLSINLPGQTLQTILTESWTNGNWQNSFRVTNDYDVNEYKISDLSQSWDDTSDEWLNISRSSYTNNPNGTVNQLVTETWDDQASTWINSQRNSYTYNVANKVLTRVSEFWMGVDWMNNGRFTNTYDGNGYLTKELTETWNLLLSSWENFSQSNYTNNLNGTVNNVVTQSWDKVLSTWNNSQRSTFTYNASDQVLTQLDESWVSGNWLNQSRITDTYDLDGNLSYELSQNWDVPSSTWENDTRDDYSFNPNGTVNQIVTQEWEKVSGLWINSQRLTFTYSQSTGYQEFENEEFFILYPNPAHDRVTIKSTDDMTVTTYSLEDQSGKQLERGRLTDKITTLDISRLTDGLYILRLGDKKQHIYKIIKN